MSKYLITGGSGFIGSHLAQNLVDQNDEVIIFDNLSSGFEKNMAGFRDKITFIQADIRDEEALQKAFVGVDGVFHHAALVSVFDSINRPKDNHDINITGTFNVLEAARKTSVKKIVLASSAAVYGNELTLPKTETMQPRPESPYALAKLTGEFYARLYKQTYDLDTVCLRYFNVFGPRQDPSSMYSGVISRFIELIAKGENPTLYGDGSQTRDFVYVQDVARANVAAMKSPHTGRAEIFNVASGAQTSLTELIKILESIYHCQIKPVFKEARSGDIRFSQASIDLIQKQLKYEPSFSLADGLTQYQKFLAR